MRLWLQSRVALGLLSIGGMTAGHYVSYLVAAPDPHHRADLLASTGHAGESPFLVLAAAAFLATSIAVFGAQPRKPAGVASLFRRLALLQVVSFGVLESIERLIAGTSLTEAAQQPVLWLGIGAQLLAALAGAWLLRTLYRAAAVVERSAPTLRGLKLLLPFPSSEDFAATSPIVSWEARAPPFPS